MLNFMDRSTIHYLHQKGWSKTEIADFTGHHRDTIARVLREPIDQQPAPRQRPSAIAVFTPLIQSWLDQRWSVQRMLEEARQHPQHPYTGSPAAFYDFVRPLKQARKGHPGQVPVAFNGLPGELLQIDWGEVRHFPFTTPSLGGQTRYFFAARLKYSRTMWVRFTTEMREETLLRCLIAVFVAFGGVPWVVTTDNMKTVVLGRDHANQPIWHPAYAKLAAEFSFHPDACSPGAGNQKGSVENLVKFVKQNFLLGRTFRDDAHLADETRIWLHRVNVERPSDATEQTPAELLRDEQPKFRPLPATAHDYGFFDTVKVSRESLITLATNRYSVPVHLVGLSLSARIHPTRIALYHGATLVATHPRHTGRNARVVIPEHYEAVFAHKPRARVMAYRDWLVQRSALAADYVSRVCEKRYAEMEHQILALYQLAQQAGEDAFQAALELAHEQQMVGAEYVEAILAQPAARPAPRRLEPPPSLPPLLAVPQAAVERDLAHYEQYVVNRAAVVGGAA
jgi:transposase